MERIMKLVAMIFAVIMVFSALAFAANKEDIFVFTANSQKRQSDEWAKPNDGDPYGYATTVASAEGITSNVFPNGGLVYARIYHHSGSTKTGLWTFYTNTKGGAKPYSGTPKYRENHYLQTEIENAIFAGRVMYQGFRWCP